VTGVWLLILLALATTAGAAVPLAPGTYRLDMRIASHASMAMLGALRSTTVSTSLVGIRTVDGGLEQTHRTCDVRFEGSVPLVHIEMPPRFVVALATPSYPVTVWQGAEGWHYQADLGVEYVGWRPDEGGTLPCSPDDPRVYDWDHDGFPGATLRMTLPLVPDAELYIVQRGHSLLDGRIVAPGRVEGRIDVRLFEQAVIGAKPAFLRRSPQVVQEPERSRFVLQAVPAGSTCADLDREAAP
jgi:hypothetical protein